MLACNFPLYAIYVVICGRVYTVTISFPQIRQLEWPVDFLKERVFEIFYIVFKKKDDIVSCLFLHTFWQLKSGKLRNLLFVLVYNFLYKYSMRLINKREGRVL